MFATVRTHLRRQSVGYVALFIALGGTAWANHETIFSSDIVDGEVKTPDIAAGAVGTNKLTQGAVTTGKVKDNNLTGGDVADGTLAGADVLDNSLGSAEVQGLGAHDISDTTFSNDDISGAVFNGRKQFSIPGSAIESFEIENNQVSTLDIADGAVTAGDIADGAVTEGDLATSAKTIAYTAEDPNTGPFVSSYPAGGVEGSLTLPAGTYVIDAKIVAQQNEFDVKLFAECHLDVGSTASRDTSVAHIHGTGFDAAPIPLQSVDVLPSGGDVKVRCSDAGIGLVEGRDLKITAIRVGSIG